MPSIRIGIIGDLAREHPLHIATDNAIQHAARSLDRAVEGEWLPTQATHEYAGYQALWCSPGSPYHSLEGALEGIRYAREHEIPFLGTCGGSQHAILEFARNVLGVKEAGHAEYDPYASVLFVTPLSCSLVGKTMRVHLVPSQAAVCYGREQTEESYYCNFGLNPVYEKALEDGGLRIVGRDENQEARVFELPSHPFFLATLFVPQANSTENSPHPLIAGLCRAAVERSSQMRVPLAAITSSSGGSRIR